MPYWVYMGKQRKPVRSFHTKGEAFAFINKEIEGWKFAGAPQIPEYVVYYGAHEVLEG